MDGSLLTPSSSSEDSSCFLFVEREEATAAGLASKLTTQLTNAEEAHLLRNSAKGELFGPSGHDDRRLANLKPTVTMTVSVNQVTIKYLAKHLFADLVSSSEDNLASTGRRLRPYVSVSSLINC